MIEQRKKDATRSLEYKHNISPYTNGLGQPFNELSMCVLFYSQKFHDF